MSTTMAKVAVGESQVAKCKGPGTRNHPLGTMEQNGFHWQSLKLRQFLGLANYFRKFIQGYSLLAAPLTSLTGARTPWVWGEEQQAAFQALKDKLISAPILALPDFSKPFKVVCDACDFGIGAVLMQDDKVVAYYSKKLLPA